MVWSLTGVLNATPSEDAVVEFIDTYVNAMPRWEVSVPSADTNQRNMQFNMGNTNLLERNYMYLNYTLSPASYNGLTGMNNYNNSDTWQEQVNSTFNPRLYPAVMTGYDGNWKVWTSDELENSWMILDSNGGLLWAWIEMQTYFAYGPPGWSTVTADTASTVYIGATLSGGATIREFYVTGLPEKSTYSGYERVLPDLVLSEVSPANEVLVSPGYTGKVVRGFSMCQFTSTRINPGRALGPVGVYDTDDLLLQLGVAETDLWGSGNRLPLSKVTDGTNWWLRTHGNLEGPGYLLPVGTEEPYFNPGA